MGQYGPYRSFDRIISRTLPDVLHRLSGWSEKMMFWVLIISAVLTALTFGLNLQGLTGAIMLGLTVLIIDHYCSWLRILIFGNKLNIKVTTIIGGFFFRIINVALFILIGTQWLIPNSRRVFYWIVITIPVWNLLSAYRLAERFKIGRR
jgi:hypothetical protein